MLRWLARRRFAVASSLVAASVCLTACDTLRSWGSEPAEARRPPLPPSAPPSGQRPPPLAEAPQPPAVPPLAETQNVAEEQSVKVALLLPLSGRLANLGKAMSDAAEMALFDLADHRFELVPIDDKGTASGSAGAARQAVAAGAQLIVGPLLAASVRAVAPVSSAAGVPVIAFSSDRKVAAPGIHIIGFTPEAEVQRVVSYAVQSGLSRFAVLAPDNMYGSAVVDALRRAAATSGATVVRSQLYNPTTQDFTPLLRKLTGTPDPPANSAPTVLPLSSALPVFDSLLLAEGGSQLRSIAAGLAAAGIATPGVQLLGTGKWDEPGIGSEPALVGAWFAAPPPYNRDEFEMRYKRTFGQPPPRLATLAYDAMALAAVLARGPERAPFSEGSLTDPNGFFGRDGLFRLNQDGVAERVLAILRVERGGVSVLDEPLRTFAAGS